MKKLLFSAIATSAMVTGLMAAQSSQRTASFTSNTVADSGRCTVEVVVPGEARVRIHGDTATLVKVSGRDPEWRKFECTSQMPKKPAEFRVETTGGRGHEELVHGPRGHSGTATVFINDPKHGEDTYSFEVVWGNAASRSATK